MRFDDTNPVKEDQEFVDSILESVRWIGFDWQHGTESNLYHASDYFEDMYRFAEYLIETGYAYVDQQSADDIRANRGTLTQVGSDSPYRDRPIAESLRLFREMRAGKHAEGTMVLRAKIDMASPNINMRDPVIYRIRFAEHHMTGTKWVVYPLYAYAHPIEDALENITHSICTLEFEDQRPWYDWVLERIVPLLRQPQYQAAQRLLGKIYDAGEESRREFALLCSHYRDKLGASRYGAPPMRCSHRGPSPIWPRMMPTSFSSCCVSRHSALRLCFRPRLTNAKPTRFYCHTSTSSIVSQ